jgi:predicted dehydrogenase
MNNRRSFLRNITAATSATFLAPASFLRAQGSNDAIRIAGIGVGGRGPGIFKDALYTKNARLVALCDVDAKRVANGKTVFEQDPNNAGQSIATYSDIRRLLENKDIDAVMIATPNHWHSLAAIWAAQAGKDVYVEKPVSHTVWEGRQLAAAALKYDRIIQSGTQSRSSGGLKAAVEWLKGNPLGKLKYGRGTCYKPRGSIKKVAGPQPIPEGLDFDLWCGPAPKVDILREKLHYDWHWIWNYGNGDLGNQGVHQADIARWFLGEKQLPASVVSIGGRLGYVDDGETPNTQTIAYGYEKAPLYFEVRGLPSAKDSKEMDNYRGSKIGVVLQYENGHILIPSYTSVLAYDNSGKLVHSFGGDKGPQDSSAPHTKGEAETHAANFLKAVRSRNRASLSCESQEGHVSAALCHIANISHRLGKNASIDEIKSAIRNDAELSESLGRMAEHLGKNAVDLAATPLTLGANLRIDPKTERFVGNEAANGMLHRNDRKGFEIPKIA